jgi:hypothetical protein
MTEQLRISIEDLRTLSPQLNKATDGASRTVQTIEQLLNDECSIGIPVEVGVERHHDGAGFSLGLGYRRVNGKFRIAVVNHEYVVDEEGNRLRDNRNEPVTQDEAVAWNDATRGDKLKTFRRLPELLQELAKEVRENILHVEETTAAVEKIKAALEPATPAQRPTGRVLEPNKRNVPGIESWGNEPK